MGTWRSSVDWPNSFAAQRPADRKGMAAVPTGRREWGRCEGDAGRSADAGHEARNVLMPCTICPVSKRVPCCFAKDPSTPRSTASSSHSTGELRMPLNRNMVSIRRAPCATSSNELGPEQQCARIRRCAWSPRVYAELGSKDHGISAGKAEVHLTIRCWNDEELERLQQEIEAIAKELGKRDQLGMEIALHPTLPRQPE